MSSGGSEGHGYRILSENTQKDKQVGGLTALSTLYCIPFLKITCHCPPASDLDLPSASGLSLKLYTSVPGELFLPAHGF